MVYFVILVETITHPVLLCFCNLFPSRLRMSSYEINMEFFRGCTSFKFPSSLPTFRIIRFNFHLQNEKKKTQGSTKLGSKKKKDTGEHKTGKQKQHQQFKSYDLNP